MSYVRFSNQTSAGAARNIVVDIPAVMTWNLPVTRQAGQATFTLPADSDALNSDYIDPDGMSWVHVYSSTDIGDWTGYITGIRETAGQTVITAVEWWNLLTRIPVQVNRQFLNVNPAVIVKSALGATQWPLISAAETDPHIASWTFYGETVWDHIQRMMDLSGLELYTGADQTFYWGTQTGTFYKSAVLLAPADLIGAEYGTDATQRVTQVTAISGDSWYTARGESGDFGAHAVLKQSTNENGLAALAENELIRRSQPITTLTGQLNRNHWAIGLGDTFSAFIPFAALGAGRLRQCRIVSKQYDSPRDAVSVNVQLLSASQVVGVPSSAIPTPLGGSRFIQATKEETNRQRRGRQYLTETTG